MTNYITDVDVAQLCMCAHIFAGGLSQYPEFLAGVFDLQFDFCAGIYLCGVLPLTMNVTVLHFLSDSHKLMTSAYGLLTLFSTRVWLGGRV